jgi:hypothetical protein
MGYEKQFWEYPPTAEEKHVERLESINALLNVRINEALLHLREMIDGGEECHARDSQISDIIRILQGE